MASGERVKPEISVCLFQAVGQSMDRFPLSRRWLFRENLSRLPLNDWTVFLPDDMDPQLWVRGILLRLIPRDEFAICSVDLFHDPPALDSNVIVIIRNRGPQDVITMPRLCKLWIRLVFCHLP